MSATVAAILSADTLPCPALPCPALLSQMTEKQRKQRLLQKKLSKNSKMSVKKLKRLWPLLQVRLSVQLVAQLSVVSNTQQMCS